TITEQTTTISLPVLDDGVAEGSETASFALAASDNYELNAAFNEATFTLADTLDQATVSEESELTGDEISNSTIPEANALSLSVDNPFVSISGLIGESFSDLPEDVDFFSFELEAGQTVGLDIDTEEILPNTINFRQVVYPTLAEILQKPDTELRLFDADGNELATNWDGASPGEDFSRDPYLEFTAETAGTYYVGVSQLGNRNYDPFIARSGSGWTFPEVGVNNGFYDLMATLTDSSIGFDIVGTEGVDTLIGNDQNNNIDGLGGNDTIAGGLANDLILGGDGDDVLRGDLNERSPQDDTAGGNDIIFGGKGSDRIGGKSGNDILSGDAGDDFIWGDDGDDIIMGVTGNDILVGDNFSGGSGSDIFVFGSGDGTDTIMDFEVGVDRIGLIEGELSEVDVALIEDNNDTVLGLVDTGETLAILSGVQASSLDGVDLFTTVLDVSNPEAAMALI
ncbi:MAG: pre-peptidase C-terminal domain-containing protein, partial [Cyanobacteria bacterium J06553_1]